MDSTNSNSSGQDSTPGPANNINDLLVSASTAISTSTTAQEYIARQLRLEADAREVLPYQFDTCTAPLGPLRQAVFACLTCTPPPPAPYNPPLAASSTTLPGPTYAGVCYSCSISCHGTHSLVELFTKRDFECDCGTARLARSNTPCALRHNAVTGRKGGVIGAQARQGNEYNHNFAGRFCGCGEVYDGETEKGVMFQCLGLGKVGEGGCGQDWWHPGCLMGLPRGETGVRVEGEVKGSLKRDDDGDGHDGDSDDDHEEEEEALPPGFPDEDDFEHLICYKCTNAFPWIKAYAAHPGWLSVVAEVEATTNASSSSLQSEASKKRKAQDSDSAVHGEDTHESKKLRIDDDAQGRLHQPHTTVAKEVEAALSITDIAPPNAPIINAPPQKAEKLHEDEQPKHALLPPTALPTNANVSLFLPDDFYPDICHCPVCYTLLRAHPQLLEPEPPAYEPPLSQPSSPTLQPPQGQAQTQAQARASGSQQEREADTNSDAGSEAGSLLSLGEAALNSMDRVQAIEGVRAYQHVREKVRAFLKPFAESGREVAEGDVVGYFERLKREREEEMIRAAEGR